MTWLALLLPAKKLFEIIRCAVECKFCTSRNCLCIHAIMDDNKEIVKWLSHMNTEGSYMTVTNTTMEKEQPLDNRQQTMDRINVQNENPNLAHLQNAIAETAAEDTTLAKEVSELLDKLQIGPGTLADDVKESLRKVSMVLKFNGLSEADETALILSMDGKRIEKMKQARMERDLKAKYEELLNRHTVLKKKLNYLEENVGSIKDSIADNEVEYKNEYCSNELQMIKLVEYNAAADTVEADIGAMNLRDLEPDKILDKYKKFLEKKNQLVEIDQGLLPYSNVPPNLLQARALLEEKELEYNEITQKSFSA